MRDPQYREPGNLKGRNNFGDLDVDEGKILTIFLKENDMIL
jgi:hypothetical protein